MRGYPIHEQDKDIPYPESAMICRLNMLLQDINAEGKNHVGHLVSGLTDIYSLDITGLDPARGALKPSKDGLLTLKSDGELQGWLSHVQSIDNITPNS